MGTTFSSILESILNATIFRVCYYIERVLCYIIDLLYQMFEVFAGLVRVQYNGTADYLINIFFSNKAVSNIYWGMALIGIVLCFGFVIFAVVKKMFDASGKVQQSLGQIIWSGIRSILIILGMTAIMNVVLNGTGVLMQQVNYLFNDPYNLHLPVERSFTGEEIAAMGRILCTIGNYSKVETENNRYNMNLCFNDIRQDMYYLQQQGVFEYTYFADSGQEDSWQSVLAQIALSCDLKQDVKVDKYYDGVSRTIEKAMRYLKNTSRPRPVPTVTRSAVKDNGRAHLDRMIFLMGTFRAARNSAYNVNPAFDDALRGPYYYGEGDKSIHDLDDVDSDFNIGFPTDYIVVWVASIAMIFDLVVIILNCVARIFNMLFLYLIAPPVIAVQPLDNGGKTKQWMTAFLVQSLSVFGTVISMRLLLLFLPMVVSPELVLFDNAILNALAKLVLIYGGFEAAKKSSSILTGILADSAGWQAVQAGDMSSSAGKALGAATKLGKAVGGKALGAASFAAKPLTNRLKAPFQKAANAWSNSGSAKYDIQASENKKQSEANDRANPQRASSGPSSSSSSSSSSTSNTSNTNNSNSTQNNLQNNQSNPGGSDGPGVGPGGGSHAQPTPNLPPPQNLQANK